MDIIKYYENIGLSNDELMTLANGRAKVVIYPDIGKYRTIDEFLYPFNAVFLLYESRPRWGHWNLIHKLPGTNIIECFDPYGTKIDHQLRHINPSFRKMSNQELPWLTYLLYNSPYEIHYNEHKFQKDAKNIKTCGRWAYIRYLYNYLSLEEFKDLFKNKYGDEIVTYLTAWVNMV